jgi:DNA-directed RNA polymerase subunit F
MASTKLIQESPLPLPELKEKLESIEKRDKELTFRGNKVKDYLNKLIKLDTKQTAELKQKILDLEIPRIKDRQIIKILDILPEDLDDLRSVFTGETTTVTQENMEKLIEAVKPYLTKKRKK